MGDDRSNKQLCMDQIIHEIEDLRKDAKLGKHKHFIAAERKGRLNTGFGSGAVVANVAVAFVLFPKIAETNSYFFGIVGTVLALIAAALSGLQTFLKLDNLAESHRRTGNQYISVARRSDFLLAKFRSGAISEAALMTEAEQLISEYLSINEAAERIPTSKHDHQAAQRLLLHMPPDADPGVAPNHK